MGIDWWTCHRAAQRTANGESIHRERLKRCGNIQTEIEQDVENNLFSFVVNVIVNLFSNAIVIGSRQRAYQPAQTQTHTADIRFALLLTQWRCCYQPSRSSLNWNWEKFVLHFIINYTMRTSEAPAKRTVLSIYIFVLHLPILIDTISTEYILRLLGEAALWWTA